MELAIALLGLGNLVALFVIGITLACVRADQREHWLRFNDLSSRLSQLSYDIGPARHTADLVENVAIALDVDKPAPAEGYPERIEVSSERLLEVEQGLQFVAHSLLKTHGAGGRQAEAEKCRRRVSSMLRKALK